jgi:uncharacterized OsmC-like protein
MSQEIANSTIDAPSRIAHSSTAPPESAERLRRRQRQKIDQYRHDPEAAWTLDYASTRAENAVEDGPLDPLHTWVEVGSNHSVNMPVAVHSAVGGLSDLPVPGDLLCAALASCADSTLRVVANALQVELQALSVEVVGEVDVRGAFHVSPEVPVRFQRFHMKVFLRAAPGTNPGRLERILAGAEQSCVVMQTLRAAVPIEVEYDAKPLPESH